jgi:hypothetical protein
MSWGEKMQRFIALILVLVCATASAEVFRWVGPDGEVYFSDTPTPGSERMDLGTVQAVPLRSVPHRSSATEQPAGSAVGNESVPPYVQFEIIKPSNGQGVRANDGSVTVYLSLQPALRSGDTVVLNVDGQDGASIRSGDMLNFNLSNMSRGQHSVAARVQNAKGEKLIETGPVSFYVLRAALGG